LLYRCRTASPSSATTVGHRRSVVRTGGWLKGTRPPPAPGGLPVSVSERTIRVPIRNAGTGTETGKGTETGTDARRVETGSQAKPAIEPRSEQKRRRVVYRVLRSSLWPDL